MGRGRLTQTLERQHQRVLPGAATYSAATRLPGAGEVGWRVWGNPTPLRLRLCTLSTCVCVCVPVCVCILSTCVCVHVRRAGWKISCRLAGDGGGSLQVLWQRYAAGWVGQWQEVATLPWGGHLTQGWPHNPGVAIKPRGCHQTQGLPPNPSVGLAETGASKEQKS